MRALHSMHYKFFDFVDFDPDTSIAEALHEKQREMREFEAVFLADSGLFELVSNAKMSGSGRM